MSTCFQILSGESKRHLALPAPADRFDTLARGTTVPGEIAARARIYHQLYLMAGGTEHDEQSAVFHATLLSECPGEKPTLAWAPQWARTFLPHLGNHVNVNYLQGQLVRWYGRALGLAQGDIDVVDAYECAYGHVSGMITAITAGCFYRALTITCKTFSIPRFDERDLARVFGIDCERELRLAIRLLPDIHQSDYKCSKRYVFP